MQLVPPLFLATLLISCSNKDSIDLRNARSGTGKADPSAEDFSLMSADQLATQNLLCEPISGQPKSYQGSGACAGNVSVAMDLSSLYDGLTLHYNSTWNTNRLGLGPNVTLSDIAFANPNGGWIQLGDGTYVSIYKKTSGVFANKFLAVDRSETTSTFETVGTDSFKQSEMDGTVHLFKKQSSGIFHLSSSANRYGEAMTFSGGIDGEILKYSDGKWLNITHPAGKVVISRDSTHFAEIAQDSSSRLTELKVTADKTIETHAFTYDGTSVRIATYRHGVAGGPAEETQFHYDSKGRLGYQINSDGTATRFVRDFQKRTVESVYHDGTVLEEKFDVAGKLVSSKHYVLGKDAVPLSEMTYEYTTDKVVKKIVMPRGRTEIEYDTTDPTMPLRSKTFVGATLMSQTESVRDPNTWLSTVTRQKGPSDQVESETFVQWTTQWPYLPLAIENSVAKTCSKFVYATNQTTVSYFKAVPARTASNATSPACSAGTGTKINEEVYDRRNLMKQIDPNAPADRSVTTYVYGASNNLTDIASAGKNAKYTYDTSGRLTSSKDPDGTILTFTYDASGEVETKTVQYPTGAQQSETYSRQFHQDGSVSNLTKTVVLPNAQQEVYEFRYANRASGGTLEKAVKNGVEL